MNKYKLILLSIVLILLINLSFAVNDIDADSADQGGTTSTIDDYGWLNESTQGWSKGVEETAWTMMALVTSSYQDEISKGVAKLKAVEDSQGCWPQGGCDVKKTAIATLALVKAGQNVDKELKWLNGTQIPALSKGNWFIQISTQGDGKCETSCAGETNKKTWNIEKGLIKGKTSSWLNANDLGCGSVSRSTSTVLNVDCSDISGSVSLSLLYNYGNEYYILQEGDGSKVSLVTKNEALAVMMPQHMPAGCIKN